MREKRDVICFFSPPITFFLFISLEMRVCVRIYVVGVVGNIIISSSCGLKQTITKKHPHYNNCYFKLIPYNLYNILFIVDALLSSSSCLGFSESLKIPMDPLKSMILLLLLYVLFLMSCAYIDYIHNYVKF